MGFFEADQGWGTGVKKAPKKDALPKICHTYPTMIKLGTVIHYLKKINKYTNHVTHLLSYAGISIFHRKSPYFAISKNTDKYCVLIHNF